MVEVILPTNNFHGRNREHPELDGPAWASYAIAILVYWSVLATEAEDHATMVSDQLRC